MNESESIICIYTFSDNLGERDSAYYVSYAYNSRGILDQEMIEKIYDQTAKQEIEWRGEQFGPFDDLTGLNKFAYNLTQEFKAAGVGVLSVDEYNSCLDQSSDSIELKKKIFESSNKIENPDFKNDKGLLSKIFS